MTTDLRNFLAIPYEELEELNLKAKAQRMNRVAAHKIQEERIKYLSDEKRIKAVTVLFSDLEGRLHMLDYDKKFLVKSWDNLTFDGSSIRGFTAQRESDLRLGMDWSAFYWGPADVFGSGKVLVFGEVIDKDGSPYSADIRGVLKTFAAEKSTRRKGSRSTRLTKSKASFSMARTPKRVTTKPGNSITSIQVVTTIRCLGIRCARLLTPARKCSVPWASRTKKIIRKSRLRSSKSTTGTAKWWRRPIRFNSIN